MTPEQMLLGVLSITSAVLGWFAREMWSAVKQLRGDLDALRVHLAEHYPNYDRLKEVLQPMKAQLDRIEAALTHKVDKP